MSTLAQLFIQYAAQRRDVLKTAARIRELQNLLAMLLKTKIAELKTETESLKKHRAALRVLADKINPMVHTDVSGVGSEFTEKELARLLHEAEAALAELELAQTANDRVNAAAE